MSLDDRLRRIAPADRSPGAPAIRRWTREECYRLLDAGIFVNRRAERIHGHLIESPQMTPRHAAAISVANVVLMRAFPPATHTISVRCPIVVGPDHDPEPDLAVVAGPPREHFRHPTTALLVAEVADVSLSYDRDVKAPIYAEAVVAEYWIVNLVEDCVEVYRNPVRDAAGAFRYGDGRRLTPDDEVAPLAAPASPIPVKNLLP